MAKKPVKDNDDTEETVDIEDTTPEAAKVPEGDLPSQLQPYPTGGKIPERDVYGNVIPEDEKASKK